MKRIPLSVILTDIGFAYFLDVSLCRALFNVFLTGSYIALGPRIFFGGILRLSYGIAIVGILVTIITYFIGYKLYRKILKKLYSDLSEYNIAELYVNAKPRTSKKTLIKKFGEDIYNRLYNEGKISQNI